jgi:hypothetical protein
MVACFMSTRANVWSDRERFSHCVPLVSAVGPFERPLWIVTSFPRPVRPRKTNRTENTSKKAIPPDAWVMGEGCRRSLRTLSWCGFALAKVTIVWGHFIERLKRPLKSNQPPQKNLPLFLNIERVWRRSSEISPECHKHRFLHSLTLRTSRADFLCRLFKMSNCRSLVAGFCGWSCLSSDPILHPPSARRDENIPKESRARIHWLAVLWLGLGRAPVRERTRWKME